MGYVVGVDESGTGAWAGPFMVAAVACDVVTFNRSVGKTLRDSKKLSDRQRRQMVIPIQNEAEAHHVVTVPVEAIADDHREAWRKGMEAAVHALEDYLDQATVIVDGPADGKLRKMLLRLGLTDDRLIFEHRADSRYPAVMAASILAKTARNDAMIALDSEYPEFLWAKNAGYGTAEHWEACQNHGVTVHHRPIRKLSQCAEYEAGQEWFGGGSGASNVNAMQALWKQEVEGQSKEATQVRVVAEKPKPVGVEQGTICDVIHFCETRRYPDGSVKKSSFNGSVMARTPDGRAIRLTRDEYEAVP